MAVTRMGNYVNKFYGLSTDDKPTPVQVGSTFLETDTGFSWITYDDGTNWVRNTVGEIGHNISSIADNRKVVTTAGTAVALAASTTCKYVVIAAEADNTGVIAVGGSTVVATLATRRGIPLNAGEKIGFPIDNLADVYIDSTVNGDGVTFTYLT